MTIDVGKYIQNISENVAKVKWVNYLEKIIHQQTERVKQWYWLLFVLLWKKIEICIRKFRRKCEFY